MKKLTILFIFICLCTIHAQSQWETLNNDISKSEIRCIASIENNLMIGTRNGLFMSSDNGETWNQKMIENSNPPITSLKVYKNNIYVATFGDTTKFCVSKDLGNSWQNLNWSTVDKKLLSWKITSIAINDANIIILIESLSNGTQVHYSSNDGEKWNRLYSDDNLPSETESIDLSKNGLYMNLPLSDGPQNEVYLYYLKNIQDKWRFIKIPTIDGTKLADGIRSVNLTDSILYIGTRLGKVFSSIDNGKTFIYLNKNIKLKYITSILTDDETRMFVATQGTGIWATGNDGYTWAQTKGLTNVNIKDLVISGNYIYALGIPTGLFRARLSDFKLRTEISEPLIRKMPINIYPNPATDKIIISSNEPNIENISVFNIFGLTVKQIELNKEENISDLPNGCYFIHVGNEFKNFMVQR